MSFSKRHGYVPVEKLAQYEAVDEELRNSLWSAMYLFYWTTYKSYYSDESYGQTDYLEKSNMEGLAVSLWLHVYKKPVDVMPVYWEDCIGYIRGKYFSSSWNEVYDLLEFISMNGQDAVRANFEKSCNDILDAENSAYRFVNGNIAEITSKEEITEVEDALTHSEVGAEIRQHLTTAIGLMSNRKNPDYRNSIKESISAVEALARKLQPANGGKFGAILAALENSGVVHGALKTSFSALYGYTSDANGIRHALLEEDNLELEDARFMLISCSAFINYVVSKSVR